MLGRRIISHAAASNRGRIRALSSPSCCARISGGGARSSELSSGATHASDERRHVTTSAAAYASVIVPSMPSFHSVAVTSVVINNPLYHASSMHNSVVMRGVGVGQSSYPASSMHNLMVMRAMGGGPRPKKPRYDNSKKKGKKKNANASSSSSSSKASKKKQKRQSNNRNTNNNKSSKRKPKLPPRLPKPKSGEGAKEEVPPAYLYPTASPHAYIAGCAAEESGVDPRSLFADARDGRIPLSFLASQFEYVSPKSLGHELPDFPIPEVCFLGKSNVGKSSLINALTKRKELAKISKTPGRTQQVNYFALVKKDKCKHHGKGQYAFHPSDSTGFLIDLPGYGYAAAPDEKVSDWQAKTQQFLLQRRDSTYLRRIFLLVDARHGVANFDRAVMGWFDEASIPYAIVLTKADRVGRPQLVRIVNDVCMRYHSQLYGADSGAEGICQSPIVHITSSRDGEGIEALMWAIDADFVADGGPEEYEEWDLENGVEEGDLSAFDYGDLEYSDEDEAGDYTKDDDKTK